MRRAALLPIIGTAAYLGLGRDIVPIRNDAGPGSRQYARTNRGSLPSGFIPASINRHTGKPHEHKREIARNLRRAGVA